MKPNRLVVALLLAVTSVVATAACADASPPPETLGPYTAHIGPVDAQRLGASWRPGCPLGPDRLRLVSLSYVGFDSREHRGELVVADSVAQETADIFGELYAARFPIERMETVDHYGADDDRSMAANNTSAFNCRPITGGTQWSNHSYGTAIDINTLRNPYVAASGAVSPPEGRPFTDRTQTDPGMIHADDATVRSFTRRGWTWGGAWTSPIDYQHFEKGARAR